MITMLIIVTVAVMFLLLSPKRARKTFHHVRLPLRLRQAAEKAAAGIRKTRIWRVTRVRVKLFLKQGCRI